MCSNTYPEVPALGCSGMRSITYPALCLEGPPFQFPLNAPRVERHREQVSDFACFNPPQVHSFLDRHAGHLRCLLEGLNVRPQSEQLRMPAGALPNARPVFSDQFHFWFDSAFQERSETALNVVGGAPRYPSTYGRM